MTPETESLPESQAVAPAWRAWYHRLVRRWRDHRKRQSLRAIREHMAFFGYDVSDLSDEEIEKGVAEYGKRIAKCGLSAEEVTIGLQRISNVLKANN